MSSSFLPRSPHNSWCRHYKSLHTTLPIHQSRLPKPTSYIVKSGHFCTRSFHWALLPCPQTAHPPPSSPPALGSIQIHLISFEMLYLKWCKEIPKYVHFVSLWWKYTLNCGGGMGDAREGRGKCRQWYEIITYYTYKQINFWMKYRTQIQHLTRCPGQCIETSYSFIRHNNDNSSNFLRTVMSSDETMYAKSFTVTGTQYS